ncbi:hypothetical protein DM02DRAFT_580214 [Periconia macrospinosa]|uniref:DUF2423 domain-containing protein n=1 Tax=Periconia macrospinosa TaxID=97972 RepID=A0A2V1EB64_9PLEO|nr:hypothetical protein DM02DRAFT_580214 [Periconia macrospinosa]
MAKGLRASTKKSNRSALRSRVFEPVENARLERLHQKLLEAAQQPKPENPKKNDMELDAPEETNDAASNEEDFPKGSSHNLAAVIPSSFLHDTTTTQSPSYSEMAAEACIDDDFEHLYHLLGLSSDIVGFTPDGQLELAFDPLPPHHMDVDGDATSTKSKQKDRKAMRKARKLRRTKPKNAIRFPTTRGKGATKPHSKSRVSKR